MNLKKVQSDSQKCSHHEMMCCHGDILPFAFAVRTVVVLYLPPKKNIQNTVVII